MGLFPSFKEYTLSNWLVLIGSGLLGAYAWNLHFIIEFSALINAKSSSFIYIIFHLFFITFGCLFYIKIAERLNTYWTYLVSVSFLGLSLIALLLVENIWLISLFLAVAGFNIGIGLGVAHYQLTFFFDKPQFGGRFYSLALMSIAPFMIIETLIDRRGIELKWLNVVFLSLILVLIFSSVLLGKKGHMLYIQEKEKDPILKRIRTKKWSLGFALLWGFFFTNTYYSTILVFNIYGLIGKLHIFVIEVATIFLLFSYPVGFLADIIGRRMTTVIGFFIQALAFLILPFLNGDSSALLLIFPLTIGLGFTFSIIAGLVLMFELSPKNQVRYNISTHLAFVGLGMSCGVLLGEGVKSLIKDEPIFLSLILLFIILVAIIVVFQVEETLPPASELKWRKAIRYILVLSKDGVPIYKQELDSSNRKVRQD
ncbi:MAG: MFS transporter, partial [Candidatus Heimdallarchaeaceae archaeon]